MSQCTCTTDKEMTCIVHPTTRGLKEYIAELEQQLAALRIGVDNIKLRSYELGQRELHDMALALQESSDE